MKIEVEKGRTEAYDTLNKNIKKTEDNTQMDK